MVLCECGVPLPGPGVGVGRSAPSRGWGLQVCAFQDSGEPGVEEGVNLVKDQEKESFYDPISFSSFACFLGLPLFIL